ncbi:MAG: hypothetical protein GXP49_02710 [Deltaproteobacteria bacterium]|nr:hypothetical protein [Deltaproteobacteria bacterium]
MNKPKIITMDELEGLLAASKPLREEDTGFCGPIRILQKDKEILVQEQSDKGEFMVRSFKGEEQAEDFVNKRLEEYDRMWDGCGCTIDYRK